MMKKALPLLLLALLNSCSLFQGPRGPLTQEEKTVLGTAMPEVELRSGAMYHGQDILGLSMQNIGMIKANLEPGQCIGALAGAFGGIINPLDSLLSTGKVPCIRVHLSFCKHNNSCGSGECGPTDLKCMKGKAAAVEALVAKYPSVKCFVSPRLEYSNTDKKLVTSWFTAVKKAAPSCDLVSSAMGGYVPPGVLREKHGNTPGPVQVSSNDGNSYYDSDSVKYNGYASILSMAWVPNYNLRLSSEKTEPPPPKQRPLSNRVTTDDFVQAQLMQRPMPPRPAPPAACKSVRSLSGAETFKNHSENYGAAGDSRSNKPLFITKSHSKQMDILAPDGHRIGCFKYYGPYQNLFRLYEGSCSGLTATELYRRAGGEWSWVKDGSTCIAMPTIRRWGTYR